MEKIYLKVNHQDYSFVVGADVQPGDTLAHLLREKLGLTGLKVACDEGACGGCTVLLNGRAIFPA